MNASTGGEDKAEKVPVTIQRKRFNDGGPANDIANKLSLPPRTSGKQFSNRFAFFEDDHHIAAVAGPQEDDKVELALAHIVRHASGRRTTLVLPVGHTNATRQRIPWLKTSTQPTVHQHHENGDASELPQRSKSDTIDEIVKRLKEVTPEEDLARSMTPLHLDARADQIWKLIEHVTQDRRLDQGHRQAQRSWQFAGKRVLSIRKSSNGLVITAGIHRSGRNAPTPVVLAAEDDLTRDQHDQIIESIEEAIRERDHGPSPIHRPDEHWLQAVLRRDPSIVGVEQPALREVPAWRPRDSPKQWGRGFIDLVGLDGHGNIRIVETKLAKNADDLLILQGLDYYVWAKAYQRGLRSRLGVAKSAVMELHYVLGAGGKTGKVKISPCTKPLAAALDPDSVSWRSQVVRGWFPSQGDRRTPTAMVSDPFVMLTA